MEIKLIEYDQKLLPKDLDHLKRIGVKNILIKATGFDNVDIQHAKSIGLNIESLPDYSSNSVTQWVLFSLLWLAMRINETKSRMQTKNSWKKGSELNDEEALVIGSEGAIGKKVFKSLKAIGLIPIKFDPPFFASDTNKELLRLLKNVKVIVFCCPLNANTCNYLRLVHFKAMKNKPFIINPIRRSLIDLQLVEWAIQKNVISGYAMDELPSGKFRGSNNCFFTPHIASRTVEAQKRKRKLICKRILELRKQ